MGQERNPNDFWTNWLAFVKLWNTNITLNKFWTKWPTPAPINLRNYVTKSRWNMASFTKLGRIDYEVNMGPNITSFSLLDHRFVTATVVVKLGNSCWMTGRWGMRMHDDVQGAVFEIFDEKHRTLPLIVQSRTDWYRTQLGPSRWDDGVQRPVVWHKLQGISLISNISTVTVAGYFYETSIFDPYSIGLASCLLHWACY